MERFNEGDRVTPKDPKSLWKNPSCSLVVERSYACEAPTMRDRACIRLRVRWLGKPSFVVGQFADHYDRASRPPTISNSPSRPGHSDRGIAL